MRLLAAACLCLAACGTREVVPADVAGEDLPPAPPELLAWAVLAERERGHSGDPELRATPGGLLALLGHRRLVLLDWETGATRLEVWRRPESSGPVPYPGAMTATEQVFYALDDACAVVAVELAGRQPRWRTPLTSAEHGCEPEAQAHGEALVLPDGSLLLTWMPRWEELRGERTLEVMGWELVRLDPAGTLLHRQQLGRREARRTARHRPLLHALSDGDLVVRFSDTIWRQDPTSGEVRWTADPALTDNPLFFHPVSEDLLVGSQRQGEEALFLDLSDGSIDAVPAPEHWRQGRVHEGVRYGIAHGVQGREEASRRRLVAVDLKAREERWSVELEGAVEAVGVWGDEVWAKLLGDAVAVLDRHTGELLRTLHLANISAGSVLPREAPLPVVTTRWGDVLALDPEAPAVLDRPFRLTGRVAATCCEDARFGLLASRTPRTQVRVDDGEWQSLGSDGRFDLAGEAPGVIEVQWRAWVPTTDPRASCSLQGARAVLVGPTAEAQTLEIAGRIQCTGAFD